MIVDGTVLRINRSAWLVVGTDSPALPGGRHDTGAARERGIIDALIVAGVSAMADAMPGRWARGARLATASPTRP